MRVQVEDVHLGGLAGLVDGEDAGGEAGGSGFLGGQRDGGDAQGVEVIGRLGDLDGLWWGGWVGRVPEVEEAVVGIVREGGGCGGPLTTGRIAGDEGFGGGGGKRYKVFAVEEGGGVVGFAGRICSWESAGRKDVWDSVG